MRPENQHDAFRPNQPAPLCTGRSFLQRPAGHDPCLVTSGRNRLVVASLAQRVAEPLETLVETVTGRGAGRLNVLRVYELDFNSTLRFSHKTYPGALSQAVQAKLVGDLSGVHGVGQILLVGEDQEKGVPEFVLVEHALQLLTGLDNTVTIVAVDDEDDTLGVLEVMSPEGSDLVLPTDVPHSELNVLVLDGLDVETWRRKRY